MGLHNVVRTHGHNSVPMCQSRSFGQKNRNVPLSVFWKTSNGRYMKYSPLQMRSYSPNILESPTSAETVYVSHGHMRGNRGGGAEGAAAIARRERRSIVGPSWRESSSTFLVLGSQA